MNVFDRCFGTTGLLVILFWLVCPVILCAQNTPRQGDNLQKLRIVLISPIMDLLESNELPEALVVGSLEKPSDLDRWVRQNLTDSCLAANYLVYSSRENTAGDFTEIRLGNANAGINYETVGRSWYGKRNLVERTVSATVHVALLNRDQQFLASRQLNVQLRDSVNTDLESLEAGNFTFTEGKWAGENKYSRWLEPVLVGSATATVVALFYRLRSN